MSSNGKCQEKFSIDQIGGASGVFQYNDDVIMLCRDWTDVTRDIGDTYKVHITTIEVKAS